MILIDQSVGSRDLILYPPLNNPSLACLADLAISTESKSSADVSMVRNGPRGKETIGIEFKKLPDLLASISSGRLQDTQLPQLISEYNVRYLLFCGRYRCDSNGNLITPTPNVAKVKDQFYWFTRGVEYQGPFNTKNEALEASDADPRGWSTYDYLGKTPLKWGYLQAQICSIEECGVRVVHFERISDCAQWIGCLYRWGGKAYDAHRSFQQFDKSVDLRKPAIMPGVLPGKRIIMDFADRISGIDYKRARAVAKHFTSVREMINASVEEWMKIPGIGKVLAKSAVETVTAETRREKQATRTPSPSNLDPFGD